MPKVAIYARKSTESEDRQVLSIDSQIQELKALAKKSGLEVAHVLTESKSAKAPGRLVFNNLYRMIQKGHIDSILCWKLDRLARNPVDGGAVIWAMEEQHLASIHTPGRTFLNTGMDKFWMQIEFGMAKKYVDDLSDNVKRGVRARLALGWTSNLPPLGYVNDPATKTIVKDSERFPLIRRMWDLMLTGSYSLNRILLIATKSWGLRTKQYARTGGNPLSPSVIYKLFRNPFYYGVIRSKGDLLQGSHVPMITKNEFDKVQQLLQRGRAIRPKRRTFAFTGMIRCGECSASITAEHRKNRYGHSYTYYHCTHNKPGIRCTQKSVSAPELERQILSFLDTITISPRVKDWAIARTIEFHNEEAQKDDSGTESLSRRLASCKRELVELVNIRLKGFMSDDEFADKKRELEGERSRLQELLRDSEGRFDNVIERVTDFFEFARSMKHVFETGSLEQKKAVLRLVGSNLVLKDKILSIEASKPFSVIQHALMSPVAKTFMIEPRFLTQSQRQNVRVGTGFSRWWGIVKDVRTFFLENPGAPSYQKTLQLIKDNRFASVA